MTPAQPNFIPVMRAVTPSNARRGTAPRPLLRFGLPLLCLLLFAGLAPRLRAQDTAQIQGVVTDSAGAAIPGVTVTATSTQTGASRTVESGPTGRFLIAALPIGSYSLKYQKAGFSTTTVQNVVLQIGQVIDRADSLKVASQQATVEVNATPPAIDTTKSSVSGVITTTEITQLPIANRQYLNLSLLMPGTTQDASRSFYNNVQIGSGIHYYSNSFTVDGVNNNWAEMGEPRQNFPEGAVEEFKVYSSQFSADTGGMSTGGAVSVVTKSGTNQFHGEAFEYWRNQSLNRDNSFQLAAEQAQHTGKAPLNRNQWGFDIGGPVLKDKLHFYAAWESTLTQGSYTVFTNNPAVFGAFEGVYKQPGHDDMLSLRADYQINNNQTMFVRYAQEWNLLTCQGCGGDGSPNAGYDGLIPRKSLVVGHTWAMGSNVVNDFRFQYGRAAYLLSPSQCPLACGQNVWTQIGQYPAQRFTPYATTLSFPDFHYGSDYGDDGIESHWEATDTFSIFHGAHNIKWGFDTAYIPFGDDAPVGILGSFSWNADPAGAVAATDTPGTGGFSAANLYPNGGASYGPTSFSQTVPPIYTRIPTARVSYFVTDSYSGIRNVVLSMGLRYDRQFGSFNENINPSAFPQPVPFLGDPSKRGDKDNIGPRLGLTWNPDGKGINAIRAGYGIYYGNIQTLQNFSEDRNFLQNNVFLSCSKPGQAGCPSFPSAFANGQTALTSPPTLTVLAQNFQNPYSEQYNLGYSREISPNLSLHVDGVYELTLHDFKIIDLNYPVNGVRPYPNIARIYQHAPIYDSHYKALYVRVDKRFAHHYQFLASYTLSSCLDNNAQSSITDYANPGLDWGPCSVDRRHGLVLSGSWEAPWGIVLGSIFNVHSSTPYSVFSTTRNLDGSTQYVTGSSRDQGNRNLDFTTVNAFRTTVACKVGSSAQCGSNGFLAPVSAAMMTNTRENTVDVRASRIFNLGESKHVEIIGQVFNLFGTYNYSGVQTGLTSGAWGLPTGAGPLQQAELAVHFTF